MTKLHEDPTDFRLPASMQSFWERTKALEMGMSTPMGQSALSTAVLNGRLNMPDLIRAVEYVAERQETLRIAFSRRGLRARLRIEPSVVPVVRHHDLSTLTPLEQQAFYRSEVVDLEEKKRYDLGNAPLWSLTVLRLQSSQHVLVFGRYHLIMDGWSTRIFFADLAQAYQAVSTGATIAVYEGKRRLLEAYRKHESRLLKTDAAIEGLAKALGPPRLKGLLAERQRSPGHRLVQMASETFDLPIDVCNGIRALAWRLRTTPFGVLLSCYALLSSLLTEQLSSVIATVGLGRAGVDGRGLLGTFGRDVFVVTRLSRTATIESAVAEISSDFARAMQACVPYGRLASTAARLFAVERPLPDVLLYDGYIQADPPAGSAVNVPSLAISEGLPSRWGRVGEVAQGPLIQTVPPKTLTVWLRHTAPACFINRERSGGVMYYNLSLFDPDRVRSLVDRYVQTVEYLIRCPELSVARLAGAC